MVQPDKAVRTPKLMLFVNIILFSTPAERGNWSLVQGSGGKAIP